MGFFIALTMDIDVSDQSQVQISSVKPRNNIFDTIRKHIAIINNVYLTEFNVSNENVNFSSNEVKKKDDFIILKEQKPKYGCYIDINMSDFIAIETTWIAIYTGKNLYLTNKQECEECDTINECIRINVKNIKNIPLPSSSNDLKLKKKYDQPVRVSPSSYYSKSNYNYNEKANDTILNKTIIKYKERVYTGYKLFSLHDYIQEQQQQNSCKTYKKQQEMTYTMNYDSIKKYLHCICDYSLIHLYFVNKDHRFSLENKLLAYYRDHKVIVNKKITKIGEGDNEKIKEEEEEENQISNHFQMVKCMLNIIQCETSDSLSHKEILDSSNIKYHFMGNIKCKLLDECIGWETFRFKRNSITLDIEKFKEVIYKHTTLICNYSSEYPFPIPTWIGYTIDNKVYWEENDNDNILTYNIRFEWIPFLLQYLSTSHGQIFNSNISIETLKNINVTNGVVSLSKDIFIGIFVPYLYRQTLIDTFELLIICNIQNIGETDKPIKFLFLCNTDRWFKDEIYNHFPTNEKYYNHNRSVYKTSLYDYSISHLNICSPVIRKLMNLDNYLNKQIQYEEISSSHEVVSKVVDIEDLNKYLPPCMKNIIKKNTYLKYMDRLTAVNYLMDMGYSKEDIVNFFDENNQDAIKAIYNSSLYKKHKDHIDVLSLCCSAVIVLDGAKGNTSRCIYEQQINGSNRKNKLSYTDKEKNEIQSTCKTQCKSTLKSNNTFIRLNHPIDYIKCKIQK